MSRRNRVRRILIHAGFHKTGTTSVQQMLRTHRQALRPHARVLMRPAMLDLCEAARAYSISRAKLDLSFVQAEAAALMGTITQEKAPIVIMSSEDLSGHMPGRRGLASYDAAPALMKAIRDGIALGCPDTQVTFLFTTRDAAPWLRSCYGQHLRASEMILSLEDYVSGFESSATLGAIIAETAEIISKNEVKTAKLEDIAKHRLGPVSAVLEHAGIPQDLMETLTPLAPANTASAPDLMDKLLKLNRASMDRDARRAAKQALYEMHR